MTSDLNTILANKRALPQSIIELLIQKEYEEALALAEYFPKTDNLLLIQCFVSMAQKKLHAANSILMSNPHLVKDHSTFLVMAQAFSLDLQNILVLSNNNNLFFLKYLCLLSQLLQISAKKDLAFIELVSHAKKIAKYQYPGLVKVMLLKLSELDNSVEMLMEYAAIADSYEEYRKTDENLRLLSISFFEMAIKKLVNEKDQHDERYTNIIARVANFSGPIDNLIDKLFDIVLSAIPEKRLSLVAWSLDSIYTSKTDTIYTRKASESKEIFERKAISLTNNLDEFINCRSLELHDKLSGLIKHQWIYCKAQWYQPNMEFDFAQRIFSETGLDSAVKSLPLLVQKVGYPETVYIKLFENLCSDLLSRDINNRVVAEKIFDPQIWSSSMNLEPYLKILKNNFLQFLDEEKTKKWLDFESEINSIKLRKPPTTKWNDVHIGSTQSYGESPRVFSRQADLNMEESSTYAGSSVKRKAAKKLPTKAAKKLKTEAAKKTKPKAKKLIDRFTMIDFPETCVLQHSVELNIQLTQAIPVLTAAFHKLRILVNPKIKKVSLDVKISAPSFALKDWNKKLEFKINEDSKIISFVMVPLEKGIQTVEIEFYHLSTRVGHILLKTNVEEYAFNNQKPVSNNQSVRIMQDPVDSLSNVLKSTVDPAKHTICVEWLEWEKKIRYTILPARSESGLNFEIDCPQGKDQIIEYLRSINKFFSEVIITANPGDKEWSSTCLNVQGLGNELYKKLIPLELANEIKDWQRNSLVMISTNEQWVPWELMFDGEDFWCRKYMIARYPRFSKKTEYPERSRSVRTEQKKLRRVVNVIGGGVPQSDSQRASQLFKTYFDNSRISLVQEEPVSEFVNSLKGADAIHCTCHGHLVPHILQFAKDKTEALNLRPATVKILPLEPGCLVFVNACSSSAPVLTFGDFNTFGWEFYTRGADVFIGTLGTIPTRYAVEFAENVYKNLFNGSNRSNVGNAVSAAREIASGSKNLFWLLYCIYGDPDYQINI